MTNVEIQHLLEQQTQILKKLQVNAVEEDEDIHITRGDYFALPWCIDLEE